MRQMVAWDVSRHSPSALRLYPLVFCAGVAALCWEVLWQLEASLALGVSPKGTAIVLAATMGGMSLGSAWMGRALSGRVVRRPLRVYGTLELLVGLSGVLLFLPGFRALERLDGALYATHPGLTPALHVAGIVLILGPATLAMGATIPVFGLMARAADASIATLYAINTAGAALGVFLVSFVFLSPLGVELSATAMACINLTVAAVAWLSRAEDRADPAPEADVEITGGTRGWAAMLVVLVSGSVSLGLEVAWFRALRAAFLSTTQAFAVMLLSVLIPLAGGARLAKWLAKKRVPLGAALLAAGTATLLATPCVERFDRLASASSFGFWTTTALWMGASLAIIGPPMLLLGTCLPWVLEEQARPRDWGRLYALNTLGAVAGSLVSAWVLLPVIGFARTAWLLGAVLLIASLPLLGRRGRGIAVSVFGGALALAVLTESGVGRGRLIGNFNSPVARVLAYHEGPDSSVAVMETERHDRMLVIDGFEATGQGYAAHYMVWMGRLPMILHPNPKSALVICFGTGQTANAVRDERPESLDLVELDSAVLRMAGLFDSNENVLGDPRVHPVVMDGRAWLRRTHRSYDVITLEPMPPNFAGVNSLYSREFYELARARLNPGGVVAQWVPFHLLSVHDALAIVATFQDVFHDPLLWIDPHDGTGILVGQEDDLGKMGTSWPGFTRTGIARDMDEIAIRSRVVLGPAGVARYGRRGQIITDDNQLLSYGPERQREYRVPDDLMRTNMVVIGEAAAMTP